MKRLLLLLIPVLALLILVAPVAADEEHRNSPDNQVMSQEEPGNSADAHARNEERKAEAEEEVNSETEGSSEEENENGAFRLQFYTVTGGSSDNVTDEEVDGTVKVVAPKGEIGLVIQGNIKSGLVAEDAEDAAQDFEVWVRNLTGYTGPADKEYIPLGYFMLDTFTVNEQGHGSFHINVPAEELPAGTYDIQIAINVAQETGIGPTTVVATPKNPYLTVVVGSED